MSKHLIQIILIVVFLGCSESQTIHPKDIVINLSNIKAGKLSKDNIFEWGGTLVLVYKRTDKEINDLKDYDKYFYIEQSKENFFTSIKEVSEKNKSRASYYMLDQKELELTPFRSKRKDIFVGIAMDTFLGALINLDKKLENGKNYFSTVHNYNYDLAGRSLMKKKEHLTHRKRWIHNMYIPPHQFTDDKLIIGVQKRLNELK